MADLYLWFREACFLLHLWPHLLSRVHFIVGTLVSGPLIPSHRFYHFPLPPMFWIIFFFCYTAPGIRKEWNLLSTQNTSVRYIPWLISSLQYPEDSVKAVLKMRKLRSREWLAQGLTTVAFSDSRSSIFFCTVFSEFPDGPLYLSELINRYTCACLPLDSR